MASIPIVAKPTPITISQFLGLNCNEPSETQLKLGEACDMKNIRIAEGYKLEQVEGYDLLIQNNSFGNRLFKIPFDNGKRELLTYVRYGTIRVYKDGSENVVSGITNVSELYSVFAFKNKYYVLYKDTSNTHNYKDFYYDSTTGGFIGESVAPYVPLIAIGTLPSGGGTDYEQINLLTNERRQAFSPDGEATTFYLREQNLARIGKVLVNGTETSDVTKYTGNGTVVFTTAPVKGSDTIEIYYTATDTELSTKQGYVYKNRNAILYGDSQDTHIFMWGNEDRPATIVYSDLGNSVARADYFPANNFVTLGDETSAITGIVKQYSRLIITKPNNTYFAQYEDLTTTDSSGNSVTLTALRNYPLNDTVGCKISDGNQLVQLLSNTPVVIDDSGMYKIVQTNVRTETNVTYISQRVQNWLDNKDVIKSAYDYEAKHEYWVHGYNLDSSNNVIDDEWLVYNYELDVFYKFEFPDFIQDIIALNNDLYFVSANGMFKFNKDRQVFGYGFYDHEVKGDKNGKKIASNWEMGYYNFGYEYKRKMLTRIWVSLQPYMDSNIDINIETDRGSGSQTYPIDVVMANFDDVNLGRYSFDTIYNPKPKRLKAKAKKFVYFKIKLSNDEWKTKFKILQLTLQWQLGGEAK